MQSSVASSSARVVWSVAWAFVRPEGFGMRSPDHTLYKQSRLYVSSSHVRSCRPSHRLSHRPRLPGELHLMTNPTQPPDRPRHPGPLPAGRRSPLRGYGPVVVLVAALVLVVTIVPSKQPPPPTTIMA